MENQVGRGLVDRFEIDATEVIGIEVGREKDLVDEIVTICLRLSVTSIVEVMEKTEDADVGEGTGNIAGDGVGGVILRRLLCEGA